jgi:hypothetical protein
VMLAGGGEQVVGVGQVYHRSSTGAEASLDMYAEE